MKLYFFYPIQGNEMKNSKPFQAHIMYKRKPFLLYFVFTCSITHIDDGNKLG